MNDIAAALQQLSARVEALEAENAQLRAEAAGTPAPSRTVSRRGLLRLGGAAAAAATGAVLLRPAAAGATPANYVELGLPNDGAAASTTITSTTTDGTIEATNTDQGAAFRAHTPNTGSANDTAQVYNNGTARALYVNNSNVANGAPSLLVEHNGVGDAIVGVVDNDDSSASALKGVTAGSAPAIWGSTSGHGPALRGWADDAGYAIDARITASDNVKDAVQARTEGFGAAVSAYANNTTSPTSAVLARALGPKAAGIEAASAQAEGGRFKGKTAQIRLIPSSEPTHPAWGVPGQLFVDKNNRLWFCKGSLVWKLLA